MKSLVSPITITLVSCAVAVSLAKGGQNLSPTADGTVSAPPVASSRLFKQADGIELTLPAGVIRLKVLSPKAVRVIAGAGKTLPAVTDYVFVPAKSDAPARFDVSENATQVLLQTEAMHVEVEKSTGSIHFLDAAGRILLEEATGGRIFMEEGVQQTFLTQPNEFQYGLTQGQDGTWNWAGWPVELRQQNTQVAVPFLISTAGYGILWNNASITYFNPLDREVTLTNEFPAADTRNLPSATEQLSQKKPGKPPLAVRRGSFVTGKAGEYVFFARDGDRRNEFSILVDGKPVASLVNQWTTYTVAGSIQLPANATVSVTVRGGGPDVRLFAGWRNRSQTVFRSLFGEGVDYTVFSGPEFDTIIQGYREATGIPPLWPKWAYGFWQCKERYKNQDEMIQAVTGFRERHIPLDVIVQDWFYWGKYGWGAFQMDERQFPDPATWIKAVHNQKVKMMITVWPNPSGKAGAALKQVPQGFIAKCYDAFNPAARQVRWEQMKQAFFDLGMDAWWQDGAEPGDDGNELENHQTFIGPGNLHRNAYPLFHTQGVYEGQRAATDQKRVVILTRSGYLGQQRYGAAVWSGDVRGDWETFRRQIASGLNFCLTGQPWWTTDSGGFFGVHQPDKDAAGNELNARWFQWSAFCPVMRIHGYGRQTESWNWMPETQAIMLKYNRLRHRLLPYIYSVGWKVREDGYTFMRALPMDFRDDPEACAVLDAYLFGPAFLVAPVTQPKAVSRPVYFPRGCQWVNFWTGESQVGGRQSTVPADASTIPVFVRAGAIVPLGPEVQYADEKPADPLELRIYPGADGDFTLYEDEGDNYNYEHGAFSTIRFQWNDGGRILTVGQRRGAFPGMLEKRTIRVVIVSPGQGVGDAEAKPDVTFTYDGKTKKIVMPSPATGLNANQPGGQTQKQKQP